MTFKEQIALYISEVELNRQRIQQLKDQQVKKVADLVCQALSIPVEDFSKKYYRKYKDARSITFKIIFDEYPGEFRLIDIAGVFHYKKHHNILRGIQEANKLLKNNEEFKTKYQHCRNEFKKLESAI